MRAYRLPIDCLGSNSQARISIDRVADYLAERIDG